MRILIVDDSPLMRAILKDYLCEAGFEVDEASDFKEAEKVFKRFHPMVVIKDLYMSGWDAIDSIKFFKRLDSSVKVIICSTDSSKNQILEGLKAGAEDFLLKPLDRIQVLSLLKRLVICPENVRKTLR